VKKKKRVERNHRRKQMHDFKSYGKIGEKKKGKGKMNIRKGRGTSFWGARVCWVGESLWVRQKPWQWHAAKQKQAKKEKDMGSSETKKGNTVEHGENKGKGQGKR